MMQGYLGDLGDLLRDRRIYSGYTQSEVADRIGCSRWTIARIEKGETTRTAIGFIVAYADLVGVDLTPAPTG